MAKSTPAGIVFEYDNSGGSLVDLTQYIQTINGIDVEELLAESDTFGDSWAESLGIGKGKVAPIVIGGLYDDTASSGPDALFANRVPEGPAAATRTAKITWKASKTTSVETKLQKYTRKPDRNDLTRWEAMLMPSGAVTEA